MKNFLRLDSWSGLSSSKSDPKDFLEQKRNILFSRFCLIGILAAVLQGLLDFIDGFPYVAAIDFFLGLILLWGYRLNEKRMHKRAKTMVLLSLNVVLFIFASVVPRGVGIYLLYFPVVAFSFITIEYKARGWSYFLAVLAIVLNAILVISNYQPFGPINIQPTDPTPSFALNLVISISLLAIGIDYLLKITHTAEQKLIENQIQTEKLAIEINDKNLILEKTNEELDRFVYSTSHDLRAPLASILGLINLTDMVDEPIPDDVKKYIAMMKDRINNLDGFIQEIIDYSRNSRIDLVLSKANLKEIIDEVILSNQFLENAKAITFKTNVEIYEPIKIDANRVTRVLNNLVSNAIKYNDMRKEQPFVEISAKIENTEIVIAVADSGPGIRDEIKTKIFEMFFRGTETAEGSGLGLYITREMVQKMNGTLSFESHQSVGTTFILRLPYSPSSE